MKLLKVVCAVAVLGLFAFITGAHAQSVNKPVVVITWEASDASSPVFYKGKVSPTIGSQMTASVEVFSGAGFSDLRSRTIYWYLDGGLVGGGVGKQSITFTAPGHLEIMSLRVEIPDYPSGLLVNTAHIQMVNPQAVLVAVYPNKSFTGSTVPVRADFYSFKTSALDKLVLRWLVNGQSVQNQENPQDLTISLPSDAQAGFFLSINLDVQQSNDPFVRAQTSLSLTKAD